MTEYFTVTGSWPAPTEGGELPSGTVVMQPIGEIANGMSIAARQATVIRVINGTLTPTELLYTPGIAYQVTEQIVWAPQAFYVVTPDGTDMDLASWPRQPVQAGVIGPVGPPGPPGSGGGTVTSVNNVSPVSGNVTLTASSVGADPTGAASTAQTNAQNFATNAVATETARAEAAEGTLTSNLAAEVTRAEGAESTLTTSVGAKYTKPGTGIPSSDMTSAVQTSLGLANSALQSVPDLSGTYVPWTNVETANGVASLDGSAKLKLTELPAHKTTHATGGSDALAPSDIGAAPLASPALTGTPTAPTKAALTNSTALATTAYTDAAVSVETTRATTAEGTLVPKGALVFNVRDYGAVGNGTTNDATAIQNAVNAAATNGGTVYLPPGTYLVNTGIVPSNNVALVGAGPGNTVILPGSAVSGINSTLSGTYTKLNPLTRFCLAHLTIDGTNQGASFNVGYKGVFCQYLSECTFENLVIQNCIATGLGIDFLTNGTTIHNVRAINNGRLNQGGGSGAGSNGIGIGTGQYTVEDFVISDCFASTNGRYGIMIESQTGTTSFGMRISNCFSTANYNHGFGDAGGNGAIWSHCIAYLNGQAGQFDGFSIDNGTVGATSQPSGNSVYIGCEAIANTRYGFSYQPSATNSTSAPGAGNHTYIGCKSYNNTSLGFNINSLSGNAATGFTYQGCVAYNNGASGWQVQGASNRIQLLGCRGSNNGQTSGTSKNGVTIGANVTDLTITGSRFYDSGGTQKQAYALQVSAGVTVTNGLIADNDLRGNLTGTINQLGTLTSVILRGNPGYNPVGTSSVTPGASPYTYTAGATDEVVTVAGGTVSAITYAGTATSLTAGVFPLASGQTLTVTYSAAPTMITNKM